MKFVPLTGAEGVVDGGFGIKIFNAKVQTQGYITNGFFYVSC